jgi:predicted MPP superfamily phosphohydrolase
MLESTIPSILTDLLDWVGSFWLGAMVYFLPAVVLLDLLRLVNHFLPFFPSIVKNNYAGAKFVTSVGIVGLAGLLLLGGHVNSLIPRIKQLNLPISKRAKKMRSLNLVAVSDLHIGAIVGRHRVDRIVDRINSLDPDLVLLVGDIVDMDVTPVIKRNLGEALRRIKSRFGVYAVTGNHEYIGGQVERACAYLTDHNIRMLRDQCVEVADSFFLVGREDLSSNRFGGHRRKDLSELLAGVDMSYPVILMDHQPSALQEASLQHVDLQISGHTHDGQLWPINYIVDSIYELAWGYRKISDTHFYVSDGVGTWGPPIRIGNRPEIVQAHLSFK